MQLQQRGCYEAPGKLHQGSLRLVSRRKEWNYGQREAKIIANKDGDKCFMLEVLQSWEWELGSKVRNQGDQQQDKAWCEEQVRGVGHDHSHEL